MVRCTPKRSKRAVAGPSNSHSCLGKTVVTRGAMWVVALRSSPRMNTNFNVEVQKVSPCHKNPHFSQGKTRCQVGDAWPGARVIRSKSMPSSFSFILRSIFGPPETVLAQLGHQVDISGRRINRPSNHPINRPSNNQSKSNQT